MAVRWIGSDALDVIYRIGTSTRSRMLLRGDEGSIDLASTAPRPFAFDGDGALLRLALEAMRIRLAYLFDPDLAVHASEFEAGAKPLEVHDPSPGDAKLCVRERTPRQLSRLR